MKDAGCKLPFLGTPQSEGGSVISAVPERFLLLEVNK
jgi:hypothetical protein